MPDTSKQDDYPWSWSEEIHHTATTDDKSKIWHAYTESELEDVVLRDVANTDYFVEKLQNIYPEGHERTYHFWIDSMELIFLANPKYFLFYSHLYS